MPTSGLILLSLIRLSLSVKHPVYGVPGVYGAPGAAVYHYPGHAIIPAGGFPLTAAANPSATLNVFNQQTLFHGFHHDADDHSGQPLLTLAHTEARKGDMSDMIERYQKQVKDMTRLVKRQKSAIKSDKKAMESLQTLTEANEKILKRNQAALKDAGQQLLDAVQIWTEELSKGNEGKGSTGGKGTGGTGGTGAAPPAEFINESEDPVAKPAEPESESKSESGQKQDAKEQLLAKLEALKMNLIEKSETEIQA